ncbi:MAG: dihydroorotase [Actinomycetia bacterium]|nr:dihydroorotase [Actinomycetes bacterium]
MGLFCRTVSGPPTGPPESGNLGVMPGYTITQTDAAAARPTGHKRAFIIAGARGADGRGRDLYVRDGVLVDTAPPGAERLDADGLIVLPGLVDPHTHLREPGSTAAETLTSGTAAAARGGFTAVLAMPNTIPPTHGPAEVDWMVRRAVWTPARAQVVPVGAVTHERGGKQLADIEGMARRGVRVFSDDGFCVMDPRIMRQALATVALFDGVIAQHSQDERIAPPEACCPDEALAERLGLPVWPSVAESTIVARDVQLAAEAGAHLHVCHVSCPETVEIIRWAKKRGIRVTAEVTPHHLLLSTDKLATGDTTYRVNPPLRPAADIEVLRAALADGTIDMVGTDHAPHTAQVKNRPMPQARPGMTGLEQALGVVVETMVLSGRMTWTDVARVMSAAPAALAHLTTQGRPLFPGEPANLVLVDPARRHVVDRDDTASRSRNNPYHGRLLPDPVQLTMRGGMITYTRDARG